MTTRREIIAGGLLAAAAAFIPAAIANAAPDPLYGPEADASYPIDGVAPKGTTDWHNHWSPPRASALTRTGGARSGDAGDGLIRPRAYSDIDARIEHLDRVGVERQIISLGSGADPRLSVDDARSWCSVANDDLAEVVRKYPTRFSGYTAIPTQDIKFAVAEIERGYRDLGFIGAVLPVGAVQTLEGAKQVAPVLEVLQQHTGILYFHSGAAHASIKGQRTIAAPRSDVATMRARYEKAASYARGITTLTQTDFLKPYPDVTVILAMLGGLAPYHFATASGRLKGVSGGEPISSLRRVYLDASTSRTPHTLELVASLFGADRMLFGTDYGVWPSIAPIVSAVRRSQLTEAQQNLLFVKNGQDLLAAKSRRTS